MTDNENDINDNEINSNFDGRQTMRIIFGKKVEEQITEKIRKIKDKSMEILQNRKANPHFHCLRLRLETWW